MANLNRVLLIGRLTRDPELSYTPKGTPIAALGLAVTRTWSDEQGAKQEDVTFVDITLWARLAEIAGQYLHKGSAIFLEGRLQLDTWDDRQSGQKRSKLKVIGETLQFLDGSPVPRSQPASPQPTREQPSAEFRSMPAPRSQPAPPHPAARRTAPNPDLTIPF